MEKRIKERYNESILQTVLNRYAITSDDVKLLDGFESFIYEFQRDDESYILRVGHSLRRSEALYQAEVDWINFLSAGGASVAKAILSQNNKLVEVVDDAKGGQFLATAFVKAPGKPPWEFGWSNELYATYGQLIGRMHALTKSYMPGNAEWKRHEWDTTLVDEVHDWLPDTETLVVEQFQKLMAHLNSLPKTTDSYGLIHYDAHAVNFLVDDSGTITLFDFDDSAYSWFANDIAIVLFYAAMGAKDIADFTQTFLTHFLWGYKRENKLDAAWLKEIPHFLKLREIELYAVIHRSFDVDNLEDDPWVASYMQGRKEKIENDVPYIDFEFTSLEEEM